MLWLGGPVVWVADGGGERGGASMIRRPADCHGAGLLKVNGEPPPLSLIHSLFSHLLLDLHSGGICKVSCVSGVACFPSVAIAYLVRLVAGFLDTATRLWEQIRVVEEKIEALEAKTEAVEAALYFGITSRSVLLELLKPILKIEEQLREEKLLLLAQLLL